MPWLGIANETQFLMNKNEILIPVQQTSRLAPIRTAATDTPVMEHVLTMLRI